jgi:glycosyltransferase involved in cell wall biosynthesis
MRPTGASCCMGDGGGGRRAAVIGMTTSETSGMRDYAMLQAAQLPEEGVSCSLHWLVRRERSLAASRAELANWEKQLAAELTRERPDVLLLHYSTFAYSHRGVPIFLRELLSRLRRLQIPLVSVLHELAYPWHRPGVRERVWAVSQRAALIDLMRCSSAGIVTTDFNELYLQSRRWLPRRELAIAPVFSNLPAPIENGAAPAPGTIGLFGYGNEEASMEPVLDAMRVLVGSGKQVQLRLLGAPGGDSDSGRVWQRAADARGVGHVLSFSGILPAQELSDQLVACELLLSAASPGPTSRKGTIAASLASGRPLLALDGPRTWHELRDAEALMLAQPTGEGVAAQIEVLLADAHLRAALGARGREFAQRRLSVASGGKVLAAMIERLLADQ